MKCFKKARLTISFLVSFFIEIASKREKFSPNFSSFNPWPSVATNDRKHKKTSLTE